MAENTLLLSEAHLAELRRLLAVHLPEEEVWAYGSRVSGTGHDASDLDLVVRHPEELQRRQTTALRELKTALRDSNLPLRVDMHDWAALPSHFQENILGCHMVIQDSPIAGGVSRSA